MKNNPKRDQKRYMPSRRQALLWAGGIAGGYFIAPSGASAQDAVDLENLTPRQHACLDLPVVDPTLSQEEKENQSPVELALALNSPQPTTAHRAVENGFPDRASPASGAPAKAAYASSWQKFTGKKLFVFFRLLSGQQSLVEPVLTVAREWSKYANIDFEPTTNPADAQIRVHFGRNLGHQSAVGADAERITNLNESTMTLGYRDRIDFDSDRDYSNFIVMHEFGHALGCLHEHSRADRPLRFKEGATIDYFKTRGLNEPATRFNILERTQRTLIKASTYDADSIMHYMFPNHIMQDNVERKQNFVLSKLDRQFAQFMYPGPPPRGNGTVVVEDDDQPQPSEETPKDLTIDGDPVRIALAPGKTQTFKLTVTSGQAGKPYTVYSEGNTQVVLQLFGPGDTAKDATPKEVPGHGTYDLTNDVIQATLAEGDYVVKARHISQRGGGSFQVRVKSDSVFRNRLLKSNAPQ